MALFTILVGGLEETVNRGNLRAAVQAVMNNMQVDYAQGTHALVTDEEDNSFEVIIVRGRPDDPWDEHPVTKTPRGPIELGQGRADPQESGVVPRADVRPPKREAR